MTQFPQRNTPVRALHLVSTRPHLTHSAEGAIPHGRVSPRCVSVCCAQRNRSQLRPPLLLLRTAHRRRIRTRRTRTERLPPPALAGYTQGRRSPAPPHTLATRARATLACGPGGTAAARSPTLARRASPPGRHHPLGCPAAFRCPARPPAALVSSLRVSGARLGPRRRRPLVVAAWQAVPAADDVSRGR